ncbi:hypothetical protein Q7P37_005573 [Cladosporium fusiforme]
MICNRCLTHLSRRTPTTSSILNTTTTRSLHTTLSRLSTPTTAETSTTATPRSAAGAPAATSKPGVAQPFSSADAKPQAPAAAASAATAAPKVLSSVPAGTPLKGLNFYKDKQDPVALADDEYPAWLWRVLDKNSADAAGGVKVDEGDLYAKSKKQRQRAAKALRKRALLNPDSLTPKVPLYEQSVDLPGGDGSLESAKQAGEARGGLTKAMRDKRRKGIKEDNFLRAMG